MTRGVGVVEESTVAIFGGWEYVAFSKPRDSRPRVCLVLCAALRMPREADPGPEGGTSRGPRSSILGGSRRGRVFRQRLIAASLGRRWTRPGWGGHRAQAATRLLDSQLRRKVAITASTTAVSDERCTFLVMRQSSATRRGHQPAGRLSVPAIRVKTLTRLKRHTSTCEVALLTSRLWAGAEPVSRISAAARVRY